MRSAIIDSAVRPVVRSLKEEEIWTAEYRKLEEARTSIARWIEECNGPREFTHCIFVVPCSTVLRERDRSAGNPIPRTPIRRARGMVGRFASVQELLVQCRDFFRQDKGLEEILENVGRPRVFVLTPICSITFRLEPTCT